MRNSNQLSPVQPNHWSGWLDDEIYEEIRFRGPVGGSSRIVAFGFPYISPIKAGGHEKG